MKTLILDTETTGLNPNTDHLLEIAVILWSVEYRCTLMQVSTLIGHEQPIQNPAEPINGIPPSVLNFSFNHTDGLKIINQMSSYAEYVCAHNAKFDRAFCQKIAELKFASQNWIDTQDIAYPKSRYLTGTGLNNLAIAHNIPIVAAHRALDDCQTLANLLTLVPDLKFQLQKASRPKVLVKSLEEKPGALSKQHGFRWNSIIPMAWAKHMPEEDIPLLPFDATKVPNQGRNT